MSRIKASNYLKASNSFSSVCFAASRLLAASGLAATVVLAGVGSAGAASKYSAIVVDANTGKTLYARSADAHRYPASLTKIMTLYILFDYLRDQRLTYDTVFHVTPKAQKQVPSKLGLKAGQNIKVVDLIRALVTKSANDAAAVIAENIGGTEENFAKIMTLKARALGMKRTTFKNASGLPNSAQKTTARDMAILGMRIMRDHPKYYKFFSTRSFTFKGKRYRNHNTLLRSYHGTDGIKTGYTRASGFNLTASVRRGQKHLLAVVMGGKSGRRRDAHMRNLLTKNFKRAVAMRRPVAAMRTAQNTAKTSTASDLQKTLTEKMVGRAKKVRLAQKKFDAPRLLAPPQQTKPGVSAVAEEAVPAQFRPRVTANPYVVQIGAFSNMDGARMKLVEVQQKAGRVLRGHRPVAMRISANERVFFRARFDNFTRVGAKKACKSLRRKKFDCAVMQAQH